MERCSGPEYADAAPPPLWRVGLGLLASQTDIVFGPTTVSMKELGASISLEQRLTSRVRLSFSLGVIYEGSIRLPDSLTWADLHGPVAGVGLSVLLLEQDGFVPFVMVDGNLAASALFNGANPIYAVDARVGLVAGYSFLGWLTPYLVARAFGGPVIYGSLLGTDAYHYQFGAGVSFRLPEGWDLLVEVAPLGERRGVLAVGRSF